tara:strand:+ start:179 stop:361 length:183 start_codon:yes stop_codon:yes gene_type:complete
MSQCPKLQLKEMQTKLFCLQGNLATEEMKQEAQEIEVHLYKLQELLEQHYDIRNCNIGGA